ncbi:hypothetical protein R1flu_017153 [Riccia fluitans]|uniref:LysM domain-containing protein n=1 Tax=Riccia fluitans TaxID=41844 RepID=A0ABD1XEI2_9MARC
MAAPKANGSGAGPKDNKGNNDTIAKVAGAVVVTGVVYGLYKYVTGNSDEPVGYRSHAKSEPFHEQISLEKPAVCEEFEGRVKGTAGTLKEKAGEFKGAIEDRGRDISRTVKGKGQEVRDWTADKGERVRDGTSDFFNRKSDEVTSDAEDGTNYVAEKAEDAKNTVAGKAGETKDYLADKTGKAKDSGSGWFGRGSSEANKGKEEVKKFASDKDRKANDAYDRAKAVANREKDEAKRYAGDKERQLKDTGSNFFDKVGAEANREKENVKKFGYDAEQKVEQVGSNVAHKASDLAHKVLPGKGQSKSGWSKSSGRGAGGEYGVVRGDTLWSISQRYGVTIDELRTVNGIRDADFIVAGTTINIPN